MQARIVRFEQDKNEDWFALLDCGHSQHMRHRPPWEVREWVLSEAGRAAYAGTPIDCRACEREHRE